MRRVLAGLLVAGLFAAWALWPRAHPSAPDQVPPSPSEPSLSASGSREASSRDTPSVASASDAGAQSPVTETLHDRAMRDAIRQRILQAWAADMAAAQAQPTPPSVTHPAMPERDGSVDPDYLRARIREDLLPMAQECYQHFLTRHPDTGGTLRMVFTVEGDEHVGGIVEDAQVEAADGGFADPELTSCMEQSMTTVAFRPPPHGGRLTVHYPFRFAPDSIDE